MDENDWKFGMPADSTARRCVEHCMLDLSIELIETRHKIAESRYVQAAGQLSYIGALAHALRIPLPGTVMVADACKASYLALDEELAELKRRRYIVRRDLENNSLGLSEDEWEACATRTRNKLAAAFGVEH